MQVDRLKRREFISLVGGAAAVWPLAAHAQQPAMPVIGYLSARSPDAEGPLRTPFLAALEEVGFVVGRNVAIEYRFSEGLDERLPMLASDLVRRSVTLLVATDRQHLRLGSQGGDRDDPHRLWRWLGPGPDRTRRESQSPRWKRHRRQRFHE